MTLSKRTTMRLSLLGLLVLAAAPSALAAPRLLAVVGSVGGAGNADIGAGCTTYGPPKTILDFFGSGLGVPVPGGGIGACGYVGQVLEVPATSGAATASTGVGPVILGNPGFSGYYTGSTTATAQFNGLHAEAHGAFSGGLPGSPVALFDSAGAAFLTDELTLTSPLVVPASAGYIGYRFQIDGKLSVTGAPQAYYFGEALASLAFQHNGGPVYGAAFFHTRRGEPGSADTSGVPIAGFTTGTGSVFGAGAINTLDYLLPFPITFGTPWELTLGLAVRAYGESMADFGSTAKLVGVDVFDANGNRITDFTLSSASGTNYVPGIPEPGTATLLLAGAAQLLRRRLLNPRRPRTDPATAAATSPPSA